MVDEDGDPVVFDPSVIPDTTKLFLGVGGADYQPEIAEIVRDDDWKTWESSKGATITN